MATRKQAAIAKFEASLTEHQRKLITDHLLQQALEKAESEIHAKTKYRIMPHYQYSDPRKAIYNAVFWSHAKLRHYWEVNEDGKIVCCDYSKL